MTTANQGVGDLRAETRFQPSPLLRDHGVVSGVTVVISTRQGPHGVLGVHSTRARTFTGDEVHFLLAVATVLAVALERLRADADLQKLAAFTQLNPNPAMELAPDGTVTYFNEAALKLASSVHGEHPRAVLPPNVAEILQTCLATDQSHTHLKLAFRPNLLLVPPRDPSRVVHCYVEDITNRLNLKTNCASRRRWNPSVNRRRRRARFQQHAHHHSRLRRHLDGPPGLSRELL